MMVELSKGVQHNFHCWFLYQRTPGLMGMLVTRRFVIPSESYFRRERQRLIKAVKVLQDQIVLQG
jgi:hypothetical protein